MQPDKTSRVLRSIRLQQGWTQKKMAEVMGVKQAWYSRLESGLASPGFDAIRALSLCTGVPLESFERGVIDLRGRSAQTELGPFRIPSRYSGGSRGSRVRLAVLYREVLATRLGGKVLLGFDSHSGIDPTFFVDYDRTISAQYNLDLTGALISKRVFTPGAVDDFSKKVAIRFYSVLADSGLSTSISKLDWLGEWTRATTAMEENNSYQVEEKGAKSIEISIRAKEPFRAFEVPEEYQAFRGVFFGSLIHNLAQFWHPHVEVTVENLTPKKFSKDWLCAYKVKQA